MIDTIVLRIHNLSKYDQIFQQYYNPVEERNSVSRLLVNKDTGEAYENTFVARMVYHDTDRHLPLSYRGSNNIASSHYSLSYNLNPANDFIEFNFSIPKYLYAHNIMQFVNIHSQAPYMMWPQLKMFLRKFINDNFVQKPLDEDIEINRIDFCYNQFFNSKEDALMYLDEQKKLVETYARSSKNSFRTYATSLMYVTQNYSFKIYHKGTEFEKHDYKELQKNNKLQYDLNILYEQSQCILRYEMTFRCKMLNYLSTHYFLNTKSESHYAYSNHPVAKFYRSMKLSGMNPVAKKFKNKTKKFMLKSLFDATDKAEYLMHESSMTFDCAMFDFCYNAFWEKVMQYKVDKGKDNGEVVIEQVARHIKQRQADIKLKKKYNDKESGLRSGSLLAAALLTQYINIDALRHHMPKTTFYRMKKDLKAVGIEGKKITYGIPTPRTDYLDYFIYFLKYHNQIDI